jgi:hypothetical protein
VINMRRDIPPYGAWCSYTREAKEYGDEQDIGVYIVSELQGVLMSKDPTAFVRRNSKGKPVYAYRT